MAHVLQNAAVKACALSFPANRAGTRADRPVRAAVPPLPVASGAPSLSLSRHRLSVRSSAISSRSPADQQAERQAAAQLPKGYEVLGLTEEQRQQHALKHYRYHDLTVADCMTTKGQLVLATPSTPVYDALEALVQHRITGMPVVDEGTGALVGVVSDYDLLALDSISGDKAAGVFERKESSSSTSGGGGIFAGAVAGDVNDGREAAAAVPAAAAAPSSPLPLFPAAGRPWKAFREIQRLLAKAHGQTVGDVMTREPLTVRALTNLEDAAKLLLDSRFRRLPVVDENGRLIGLLTRGNVVRAAITVRRAAEGRGFGPVGGN